MTTNILAVRIFVCLCVCLCRLWHQLTMKLEEFVRGPAFANNTGLVEVCRGGAGGEETGGRERLASGQLLTNLYCAQLYSNFICDFEDRIKPESLVGLALVIIQQIDSW